MIDWSKIGDAEHKAIMSILESQNTTSAKKKFAESIGLDWSPPTIREQIGGNGKIVHDYKRGRAIHGRTMAIIPEITLPTGRVAPKVVVEPECVRHTAFELIRLADSMGW